jgi:hypothetical protein
MCNGLLRKGLDPEQFCSHNMNMNFYTDSNLLQMMLEMPLEKKAGRFDKNILYSFGVWFCIIFTRFECIFVSFQPVSSVFSIFSTRSECVFSLYAPPGKLHLIYFIDDLNMPALDPYNTQSGIALLRRVLHSFRVYFTNFSTRFECILPTSPLVSSVDFASSPLDLSVFLDKPKTTSIGTIDLRSHSKILVKYSRFECIFTTYPQWFECVFDLFHSFRV